MKTIYDDGDLLIEAGNGGVSVVGGGVRKWLAPDEAQKLGHHVRGVIGRKFVEAGQMAGGVTTYADTWAYDINATYDDGSIDSLVPDAAKDGENTDATIRRVLGKAAQCLRNDVPTTFTGAELDLVRHLMPAHEVHQSGAVRWVLDTYGDAA